ncbi:activating signal cointegrator 1 complex subunit 1-like [Watersipora subatra]|uniref:activating signal cointegrator 1 complex subunit 1-like n=1 Tax=Watersipora subatra TaxID=2589382 RepID=UPI00355AF37B
MDVMKPPMVFLGKFCYRVNPGDSNNEPYNTSSYTDFEEDEQYVADKKVEDVDPRVTEKDGRFSASLDIPSALFKFVIGKKGETKKRLEYETKCKIVIPQRGQERPIVIKGSHAGGVSSAVTRIEVITESGREKSGFTHFISIPANSAAIVNSFSRFKEQVIDLNCGGIDEDVFQNPSKLHLTIGTMTLLNDTEINMATSLLHSTADTLSSIIGNSRLRFQGLAYMNDDPSAVDVLYATVKSADGSDRLEQAVAHLTSDLSSLLNKDFERDSVKLHLTLINSVFRKETKGSTQQRRTYDASKIFKELKDFDFGEIEFPGFHLSQRFSTGCDGYYETVTAICTPLSP